MTRKNETKTYVIEYIKEVVKTLTRDDGTVVADVLLNTINRAFPKKIVFIESEEDMTAELQKKVIDVAEINTDTEYVVYVEVDDRRKDDVHKLLRNVHDILEYRHIKHIIVPMKHGKKMITFKERKE